jgi:hypothetical protein
VGAPPGARIGLRVGEPEEVAAGHGQPDPGLGGLRRQLLPRRLGLLDAQAVDADLPRSARQELAADGRADQAVAAQDQDLAALDVHRLDSFLAGAFAASRGDGPDIVE